MRQALIEGTAHDVDPLLAHCQYNDMATTGAKVTDPVLGQRQITAATLNHSGHPKSQRPP